MTPRRVGEDTGFAAQLAEHDPHAWRQVGNCVYCIPCGLRLYQGDLPEHKNPGRAQRQAICDHDWDWEFAQGFYGICWSCGAKEWGDFGDEDATGPTAGAP